MHAGCRNACVEILLLDAKMEACNQNSKQEVVANSKPGSQTGRDLSFKLGTTTKYDLKISRISYIDTNHYFH